MDQEQKNVTQTTSDQHAKAANTDSAPKAQTSQGSIQTNEKVQLGKQARISWDRLFAKASVMTHLLQSRLALPLLPVTRIPGSAIRPSDTTAITSEAVAGLALVTPTIQAITKVTLLLRAFNALSHYRKRPTVRVRRPHFSRQGQIDRLHFLRPQVWRILKPGDERRTAHLKWRY